MSSAPVRIGIVGGGQLARMTVQAAISLDLPITVLAARPDDAAAQVWSDTIIGAPDSIEALTTLAERCPIITFDHELVDADQLAELERRGILLRPGRTAVAVAQDKLLQRRRFAALRLPIPVWEVASDIDAIDMFGARHGWPLVLKARRGGYDGRGVWVVTDRAEADTVFTEAPASVQLLMEPHLRIERELAVMVARRPGGAAVAYPVVETVQRDGMCHEVLAPASISAEVTVAATDLALRIAAELDATGVLAVELFLVDGRLLVNEIAARPHNTAHYTIEGAATSQFENHLRAISDLPLGATDLVAPCAAMVNLVGGGMPLADGLHEALEVPGVRIHLYGKEPRPGRKIGHVTALGTDATEARRRAAAVAERLTGEAVVA